MTIGFIGLGRMGQNLVHRMLEQGINVVVFNRTHQTTEQFVKSTPPRKFKGKLKPSYSVADMIGQLARPRVLFLMVSHGEAVDETIESALVSGLESGDIIIDGGNSYYKDSARRFSKLKTNSIHFIDCGTSGGLEGARHGACLMIGGEQETVKSLRTVWNAIAVPKGWAYIGPAGSGHFVKMIHNGIEYGFDQALGEGFEILRESPYELDLAQIARVWSEGSVIRSWLTELAARALEKDPDLSDYYGIIGGGETGRWSLDTAEELGVSVPVIKSSYRMRGKSKHTQSFSGKVVSALRFEYGGHEEIKPKT
jgi:6-phosphogluconate dehydrogenase